MMKLYVLCTHQGDSKEYTQRTIIVLKSENIFLNYRHLLPDMALWLTLRGSNSPYLEQTCRVQRIFEPLRFDCMSNYNTERIWQKRIAYLVHLLIVCLSSLFIGMDTHGRVSAIFDIGENICDFLFAFLYTKRRKQPLRANSFLYAKPR